MLRKQKNPTGDESWSGLRELRKAASPQPGEQEIYRGCSATDHLGILVARRTNVVEDRRSLQPNVADGEGEMQYRITEACLLGLQEANETTHRFLITFKLRAEEVGGRTK